MDLEKVLKVKIVRICVHCHYSWEEYVAREDLLKISDGEAVGRCPECQLPT